MARPVFISYAWGEPHEAEADRLDHLLRLRGVPVWRDRRDMGFGGYHGESVRDAIANDCSGFAVYLTEPALASKFIKDVELRAMADRRNRDRSFFHGAVCRTPDVRDWLTRVQETTGIDLGGALAHPWDDGLDDDANLAAAANRIMAEYLAREWQEGPAELVVETRNVLPWREDGLLHLGWHPPLAHAMDAHDPSVWGGGILPALRDIRTGLDLHRTSRRLRVRGSLHLSAALALGYEFRKPGPWDLELIDRGGAVWCSDGGSSTPPDDWNIVATPNNASNAGTLAVVVHATHDIGPAFRRHQAASGPARCEIHVSPPSSSNQSISPDDGNRIAGGIADAVRAARSRYDIERTDIYLACPWTLAALLGWHLASTGPLRSYEATQDRLSYVAACDLT